MAVTKTKQPSEVVDYDIDMTDYFEEIPDDEILSAAVTVEPAGLTLGPGTLPDWDKVGDPAWVLKIWVGDGVDGTKYKVTAVITTEDDRVEEVEFFVKVKET